MFHVVLEREAVSDGISCVHTGLDIFLQLTYAYQRGLPRVSSPQLFAGSGWPPDVVEGVVRLNALQSIHSPRCPVKSLGFLLCLPGRRCVGGG